MSDTDSFIEEVSEEVRRDRLFAWMKRYGWIAIFAVLLIVGLAAYNEYRKAQEVARAQAFGDRVLMALENDEAVARAQALSEIEPNEAGAAAVVGLLRANELAQTSDNAGAVDALQRIADDIATPLVYRQIASFKLLSLQASSLSLEDRKLGYEALIGGNPQLRTLSEEQLALILIEQGKTDEAIVALEAIVQDNEATAALKRRATQLIVALGGSLSGSAALD
ncbi:tetratricopeptide repeat protein [uncultured Lentibacter sp.]|uniref:tetratricopeptide repeat protein n=1 Tax=uncultured Lentibacter sp. TaxID=1659309 RepID=UPI00262E74D5|nr:tetratricopeptide repeat protein [uncultured Lentibacter sp.]